MDILHHFGDLLWESHADQPIPNPGFSKEMVLPLALDDVDSPPELEEDFSPVEKECNTLAEEEAQTEEQDQALIGERSAAGSAAPSGEQIVEGGIQMDGLLEIALLQALHKSVKDDMLPLPAGKLLQIHMLPNRWEILQTDSIMVVQRCKSDLFSKQNHSPSIPSMIYKLSISCFIPDA